MLCSRHQCRCLRTHHRKAVVSREPAWEVVVGRLASWHRGRVRYGVTGRTIQGRIMVEHLSSSRWPKTNIDSATRLDAGANGAAVQCWIYIITRVSGKRIRFFTVYALPHPPFTKYNSISFTFTHILSFSLSLSRFLSSSLSLAILSLTLLFTLYNSCYSYTVRSVHVKSDFNVNWDEYE